MRHQELRINILEQVLGNVNAWLHAFDNSMLGGLDEEKYRAFLDDLSPLDEIGVDVSRWTGVPARTTGNSRTGFQYNYVLFGIRLRSLSDFLGSQLKRERQGQAVAGAPLTDEQVDLLRELVMANRNVAIAQRQEIVGISADGETRFFHPGLPNRSLSPSMIDLQRLTHLGLINAYDRGGRKGWVVEILPAGEAAIDASRSSSSNGDSESRQIPKTVPDSRQYHVAISYAGPDMQYAEDLATLIEQEGYKVFFDKANPAGVWGKNLHSYLQQIFTEQALFCVVFVSREYENRVWTIKELQDALTRQVKLRGNDEYILPIQLDRDVKLPGLPASIAYLRIEEYSIERIRDLLVEKIDARMRGST